MCIYSFIYSVNQVRIRDTVEENENMFEIHRLENVKIVSGEVLLPAQKGPTNSLRSNRRRAAGVRRTGGFQATHFV